jgi:hypothetical protein
MTFVLALVGAKALYLLLVWLGSAIGASWLSQRAGFGEKPGLATGLLLTAAGLLIWVVIYLVAPRANSTRRAEGVLPRRASARRAPAG